MSNRTNIDFLSDIREAARRIKVYTAGMTYETFLSDTRTQDAVIRNLEIIGEATKNLSTELRTKYPNVPWKSMAGVRDRLIHHYFGVNFDIVWNIVIVELPGVVLQIEEIIRHESGVLHLTTGGILMSDPRPNILYIMSDDHTVNAISCYNGWLNEVVDTPNIDRIAREGMRFDNCICNNALCSPSRASIITGQYSHKNGVLRLNQPLSDDHPNFVRQLQASGYQTGIAGKWHLGSEPDGFDYWEVLPGQGAYFDPSFTRNGEPTQYEGYATDIITDLSLNWLKARDPDKPFLMLCHHKAPHGLWEYAPRHADLFADGDLPEPSNLYKPFDKVSSALENHHRTMLSQAERMDEGVRGRAWPTGRLDTTGMNTTEKIHAAYQKYVKDYLRCITAIDEGVGRLLDYLDEEGLTENTIVVYTSDQGMFLGEHSYFDKRLILEESLLMPYVMRYPRAIAPGSVNEDIVVNVDFGATYLDFAGLQPDAEVQGRSFRALCEGETPEDWRQSAFYAYWDGPTKHYGVRTQNYTLAVHRTGERDLFDLEKDPWEMTSVYGDPAYADVQAEVEADLARLIEEIDISAEELPQE